LLEALKNEYPEADEQECMEAAVKVHNQAPFGFWGWVGIIAIFSVIAIMALSFIAMSIVHLVKYIQDFLR